MNNIRYIYMGGENGIDLCAEHEITKNCEPKSPMILAYFMNKPTLVMGGYYAPSKHLVTENIDPSVVDLVRMYVCFPSLESGCMYLDSNVLQMSIHIKDADLPVGMTPQQVCMGLSTDATIEVLREAGKDVFYKPNSNDVVINENGKEKKVIGFWLNKYKKGWTTYAWNINLKGNFELMGKLFKIDTEKMMKKNVKVITDAVGEIDRELQIDKQVLARRIAERLAIGLQHNLIDSQFSSEELNAMEKVKSVLAKDEWIQEAKRPIENLKKELHEFSIEDF